LKIEREAIRLPVKDRETLAERLMRSVKGKSLTQVEEAWVKEAERRFSAWRRGKRAGVSVELAFKQIRKNLACGIMASNLKGVCDNRR
jgi:putative addiction module component (TIGR02574 family)